MKACNALIKRLKHQCKYRGTRELDLLFRSFIDDVLNGPHLTWGVEEWQLFESLLQESEQSLMGWLFADEAIPPRYAHLISVIKQATAGVLGAANTLTAHYQQLSLDAMLDVATDFAHSLVHDWQAGKACVVALQGDLGAGKSTFARKVIQCVMGVPDLVVPSPTFTLLQQYTRSVLAENETRDPGLRSERSVEVHQTEMPMLIVHADLYRLSHPDECFEIGLLERMHDSLCLIEWPERMESYLPEQRITLSFTPSADNTTRNLTIEDNR